MTIVCIFFFSISYGQKEANIWYFGSFAGLDFNSGSPTALTDGAMTTNEGCASISDEEGELLFYTDGSNVWDANHNITANGSGLLGNFSSTQSAIIVQKPLNDSIYFIFTVPVTGNVNGLRYSEFNINLNGGLGDVTEVKNVLMTTPVCEKVTAVRHANGKDIWILTHGFNSNEWIAFLVDENGVDASPIVSSIGLVITDALQTIGYMKASPNGKRVSTVYDYSTHPAEVLDFNPATGEFSNLTNIGLPEIGFGPYGLEFSPNSDILYVGFEGTDQFSQYDLNAPDIEASEVAFNVPGLFTTGSLQLGPDGKIYLAQPGQQTLSVIASPNELGLDCDLMSNAIDLGGQNCNLGLPTFFPDFFLVDFTFNEVCFGDSTCFEVSISEDVDSVLWVFGDPNAGVDSTSNLLEPCHLFTDAGDFEVSLIVAADGVFDTITQIVGVKSCCEEAIAHYSLDACDASEGETAVYAEFEAIQMCELECSQVISSIVFRDPANTNRHSCTPGSTNAAMCVSALDDCEYQAGSEKSIVFEITVNPEEGSIVRIEGLQFFEKAPEMFDWINGNSGPNNYPTLYGVRVMKNDVEVFSTSGLETTADWTLEEFTFDDLVAIEECTFTFELLGYCLAGNGAEVDAWDIDEISVFANCDDDGNFAGEVSGFIATPQYLALTDNDLILFNLESEEIKLCQTNDNGDFVFENVVFGCDYRIIPDSKSDYLNGVSTFDLVQIQKHLLGIKRFESAYEMIAADANGSETVSALDIVELRKLLLGYNESLEYVNSWRFVENTADISAENAFDFEEMIQINGMNKTQPNIDFTAVKVGDLNGNVELGFAGNVEERFDSYLEVIYSLIQENGSSRIELTMSEDVSIEGLQFNLNLSTNQVSKIESAILDISQEDYKIDRESLRLVKATNGQVRIGKGEVFATLHLKSPTNSEVKLMVGSAAFKNEMYTEDGEVKVLRLRSESTQNSNSVGQVLVSPNPYSDITTIRFYLRTQGEVEFTLRNAEGKTVVQRMLKDVNGYQEILLSSGDLSNKSGMYYYTISTGKNQKVGKLVLLR